MIPVVAESGVKLDVAAIQVEGAAATTLVVHLRVVTRRVIERWTPICRDIVAVWRCAGQRRQAAVFGCGESWMVTLLCGCKKREDLLLHLGLRCFRSGVRGENDIPLACGARRRKRNLERAENCSNWAGRCFKRNVGCACMDAPGKFARHTGCRIAHNYHGRGACLRGLWRCKRCCACPEHACYYDDYPYEDERKTSLAVERVQVQPTFLGV